MALTISKWFKFLKLNNDPALHIEAVSNATSDYTPASGRLFRGINCSAAGTATIVLADGVTLVQVYLNTGWNPQGGIAIKAMNFASDTATILAAALDA